MLPASLTGGGLPGVCGRADGLAVKRIVKRHLRRMFGGGVYGMAVDMCRVAGLAAGRAAPRLGWLAKEVDSIANRNPVKGNRYAC